MDQTFDPSPLEEIRDLDPDMGDDLVAEIVNVYLDDAPKRVAEIQATYNAGDAQALHRATHTLKGSSANVGLMGLHVACRELDDLVRTGEMPADAGDRVAQIAAIHEAGLGQLRAFIGQ